VEEQTRLSNLPKPKVYVILNDSSNAFATGRNPSHTAVAARTGIMRVLSWDELSAVLAHEMAHVGNRDTLIMTVAAAMAGAITFLAMIFGGLGGGRRSGDNGAIVGLLVVAILVRAAISTSQGVSGRFHRGQELQESLGSGRCPREVGCGSA
jgi:heat shock protein HtpX